MRSALATAVGAALLLTSLTACGDKGTPASSSESTVYISTDVPTGLEAVTPRASAPTTTTSPAQAQTGTAQGYDSACGLSGGRTDVPTSGPVVTSVERQGWTLAISKQHGPGRTSDVNVWHCYSRTPTGALLAAWNYGVQLEISNDRPATIKSITMGGTGQDALVTASHSIPPNPIKSRGFLIQQWSRDEAVLTLHVVAGTFEAYCGVDLVWLDNDWKLRVLPDGSTSSGCTAGSPANETAWRF